MRTGVQFSKDDTPGCTKEACSLRDANHLMQKRGVVVLGVSTDSVDSHEKFAGKYCHLSNGCLAQKRSPNPASSHE